MSDLNKLKKLLEHWIEHNDAHVKTYMEWAGKAETLGKKELRNILMEIAEENKKLNGLFKKALECT